MLDEALRAQLRGYFEKLQRPVELAATLDDSEASQQLRTLLQDIAALSPQVSMVEGGKADRRPSFLVRTPGAQGGIHFAGLPLGHEFGSLVLALLQVGGHPPRISAADIDRVRSLPSELRFETFYSTSCQNCPDVVQALNTMAVLNPGITHVAIDGAAFPVEAQQRGVMAVPTVFLNGQLFGQGRMELTQILDRLIGPATTTQGANPAPYDMLIVGGGPAGCAAAVYAARKGIRTALVGERMGGQLLDTLGIENFMSTSRTEGPKLAAALEAQVREHAVDLYTARRATSLEPLTRDGLTDVRLDNGLVLSARTVVLATGARWRTMNVPGEEDYRNRGVAFCPHCDGPLFKDKRVAVIGGGNSGVEAAIDLAGIAREVTLFEFDGRLRADEILQRKLRSLGNVTVHLNAETTAVDGDGRRVTGLRWRDRQSGVDQRLALEGVFVQIGLAPNTQWLPASLRRNARGDIEVDERGATSMPGIYAAGDATTVPYKQIATAIGSGATAALAAFEYLMRTAPDATARAAA